MKTYKIISLKKQHVYSEGELIRKITTNDILKKYGVDNFSELKSFTDDYGLLVSIREV